MSSWVPLEGWNENDASCKRDEYGNIVKVRVADGEYCPHEYVEDAVVALMAPHTVEIVWADEATSDGWIEGRVHRVFRWTVQLEVSANWVADGFDLTDERALDMLARALPYANMSRELAAKVLSAPPVASVRKEQGHRG